MRGKIEKLESSKKKFRFFIQREEFCNRILVEKRQKASELQY